MKGENIKVKISSVYIELRPIWHSRKDEGPPCGELVKSIINR